MDEIGKTPLGVQNLLLDVLEGRPYSPVGSDRPISVDVRIVALASEPLGRAVLAGRMLPDLRERLRMFVLGVTPLKSRVADIPMVTQIAFERHVSRYGYSRVPEMTVELTKFLSAQSWPGNHRAIDGTVQRLLAGGAGASVLGLEHLPVLGNEDDDGNVADIPPDRSRDHYLHDLSAGVMPAFKSDSEAARYYGVDRSTIGRWRKSQLPLPSDSD